MDRDLIDALWINFCRFKCGFNRLKVSENVFSWKQFTFRPPQDYGLILNSSGINGCLCLALCQFMSNKIKASTVGEYNYVSTFQEITINMKVNH